MSSLVSRVYTPLCCDSLRLRRCAGSFLSSMVGEAAPELRRPDKPEACHPPMPPLGPLDEAQLFATFEQTGKRNLLDLYNVSFFCGAPDKQGKPFGDIGLDDLIDSKSSRCQIIQEDTIWTGTARIKEKDRAYKHLSKTGQLSRVGVYTGIPRWEGGVEIKIKGKYYLHGFGGTALETPKSRVTDHRVFLEPDSNFRFEIALTQKKTDGQKDGRYYRLLTLTPDCMQRSLRAIHQASVMAFMHKAYTPMGSKNLEWYEREYKKAFPRNKVPSADVGEQDEGKPVRHLSGRILQAKPSANPPFL